MLWLEKEQGIKLFYLDFESTRHNRKHSSFVSNIQEYMDKKQQQKAIFTPVPSLMQQLIRPIFSELETQTCTGRQNLSNSQSDELAQAKRTVQDLGIMWFSTQIERYMAAAQDTNALLGLIYLCEQLAQSQTSLPIKFNTEK
ncbi:hypothetical protein M2263_000796 [Providencia alcalifaciens]|nr:hypothetical protein [Providencia alcalifaciens]